MAREIKPINYAEDYHEMKPSLFRESENLDRLLQALFDVCDVQQRGFIWLSENLLNVDVAQGFHLDFIGGIVGQPRFLSDFNTEPYFGFDKSYQSKTFGSALDPEVGGYWNSRSYFNTATSRQLNDGEYRRLIKARAIYNQSNCSANDLLEVVNLITNSKNNTVQMLRHGLIQINTDDQTGILSYFVDRLLNEDNILPIAAGVRVGLESTKKPSLPIDYESVVSVATSAIARGDKHESIDKTLTDLFGSRGNDTYTPSQDKLYYYISPKYTVYGEDSTTGRETLQGAAEFGCRNFGGISESPTMDYSTNRGGVLCSNGGRRLDYHPEAPTYRREVEIKDVVEHIIKKAKSGDALSQDFLRKSSK